MCVCVCVCVCVWQLIYVALQKDASDQCVSLAEEVMRRDEREVKASHIPAQRLTAIQTQSAQSFPVQTNNQPHSELSDSRLTQAIKDCSVSRLPSPLPLIRKRCS